MALLMSTTAVLLVLAGCGGGRPASARGQATTTPPPPAAVPVAETERLVADAPGIKTLPADLTPALEDVAKDFAPDVLRAQSCFVGVQRVDTGPCVYGDPAGTRTVVLFGDSHAVQWLTAFDDIGRREHWKVVVLAKAGCPAEYVSVGRKGTTQRQTVPFPECDQWHDYVINRINQSMPDLVVLTSGYATPGPDGPRISASTWSAALTKTLTLITSPNTKKVVLEDTPYQYKPAADCLAAHEKDVQSCSTPKEAAVLKEAIDAEQAGASAANASYIEVTPWFCSDTCTVVIGNKVVYRDGSHITSTYARFVSGSLESALVPIIGGG